MFDLVARSDNDRYGPIEQLEKLCQACGTVKPTSEFYRVKEQGALAAYYHPTARCKPCHNRSTARAQSLRRMKVRALAATQ
jgi:hypothetical protein